MASLSRSLRFGSRALKANVLKCRHNLRSIPCLMYSSTTKKVDQSEFVIGKQTEIDESRVEEIIKEGSRRPSDFDASDPTYVSHGYHDDPYWDTWANRIVLFSTVSITLVLGATLVKYIPDPTGREWAQKEAELVLAERRAAGEPLIDPNFADPSKLVLPDEDPELLRTL